MNAKNESMFDRRQQQLVIGKLFLPQKPFLDVSFIQYLFHVITKHDLDTNFQQTSIASLDKLHIK